MTEHPMMMMPHHVAVYGVIAAILLGVVMAAILFFSKKSPANGLLLTEIAARNPGFLRLPAAGAIEFDAADAGAAHDTVFILPDISHYTRFMTGNRFAFGHAQHVVFSLLNAMISAATRNVQLSKLEGDAALFFIDAQKLTNTEMGETVMGIFRAFYREQARLLKSNICRCSACSQIDNLDLKIFVHRGRASRFEFRGSIDHFGTDVIILHRMMKNGVKGDRYVMVTQAATGCIDLPGKFETFSLTEEHEHIGKVSATVFGLNDTLVQSLSQLDQEQSSWFSDVASKLRQNFLTANRFLKRDEPGK